MCAITARALAVEARVGHAPAACLALLPLAPAGGRSTPVPDKPEKTTHAAPAAHH
ncbi:hypothetical protein [Streptomyces sp. NPDC101776]|uniref:hypothetical protein n=1 Tax=Streptomyces sp. NPDC101776 TaxID=3366146 RepID=UPI0038304773